jgi:spermidine/putrescine transport system substrate-binding protein
MSGFFGSIGRLALIPAATAVLAAIFTVSCTKKSEEKKPREVSLAIWANFLSTEMQTKFEKETGIKIRTSTYSSNEELLAKVQAGASGIDVAVPSDYMIGVMVKLGLLHPIDAAKIPNKAGLDPAVMKQPFDPKNEFSMPYSWGLVGIAFHSDLVKDPIKGWKDLFSRPELAGKISLLDDVREVTAAALKVNGFSVNTTSEAELDKAKATLKEVRGKVKMFRSDAIDPLVNKEVMAAHIYSSDAYQAALKSDKVKFVLPEEGGTRNIDGLVILKGAKNTEEAHALINFLISKEASLELVKARGAGPIIAGALNFLPPAMKTMPMINPPATALSKFESIQDVGEATRLYDRLWTEIKAE